MRSTNGKQSFAMSNGNESNVKKTTEAKCIETDLEATMEEMSHRLEDFPLFDLPVVRQHLRLTFNGMACLELGRMKKNSNWTKYDQDAGDRRYQTNHNNGDEEVFVEFLKHLSIFPLFTFKHLPFMEFLQLES